MQCTADQADEWDEKMIYEELSCKIILIFMPKFFVSMLSVRSAVSHVLSCQNFYGYADS
jgi:hypothetical protein